MLFHDQSSSDGDNNIGITLERMEPNEPNGACAEYESNYSDGDTRTVALDPGKTISRINYERLLY